MAADLDVAVAVAAIEPELADVDVVLEMDRLHRLIADARILRREVIPDRQGHQAADDRQRHAGLDDGLVGAFGEDIGHGVSGRILASATPSFFAEMKK